MEKKDFRGLGRPTQEALRLRAVFLVLSLHKTQAEAAEAVGVSRQTVNQWLRNHTIEGEKGLLDRRLNAHRRGQGRLTLGAHWNGPSCARDNGPSKCAGLRDQEVVNLVSSRDISAG